MNVFLMYRDHEFDLTRKLPWNAKDLAQDLELNTLLAAMAGADELIWEVARQTLFSGFGSDSETILYRQTILKDCLAHPTVIRELYALVVEVLERRRAKWFGYFSRYPAGILYEGVELMQTFLDVLRKLRRMSDKHAAVFTSEGCTRFWTMINDELEDDYLDSIEEHLRQLQFRKGVLLSAELGEGNEGNRYVLRREDLSRTTWIERILGRGSYTFRINPRDEAGARILSEMRDCGINFVANALAQSAEHVLGFFETLRVELAFYVGCLHLHDRLVAKGEPTCFPLPAETGSRRLRFNGLYDVCLSLSIAGRVVGNTANADGKDLVVITGANQGGKSVFLRSVGLAQMMLQCGMFVPAQSFEAELCAGLCTHYKREEDPTMTHGKLDEELARMSDIVDHLTPDSLVLFNESFAATNEREGSEIARQIVTALSECRVKVLFVTHLYEFARGLCDRKGAATLFLRAERHADGTRTFRVVAGAPIETSYGEDLYAQVFGA